MASGDSGQFMEMIKVNSDATKRKATAAPHEALTKYPKPAGATSMPTTLAGHVYKDGASFETNDTSKPESLIRDSPLKTLEEFKKTAAYLLFDILTSGICLITQQTGCGRIFGTGFLFQFKTPSNKYARGLLTNHHVVNCFENLELDFENKKVPLAVNSNHVEWIISDEALDFTFMCFQETIADELTDENYCFLVASKTVPSSDTCPRITIIQHPEGENLFCSEGFIKSHNDTTITHTASTKCGSSGSPIIDNDSKVIAIHNKGGPITDKIGMCGYAEYNKGTLISKVLEKILEKANTGMERWSFNSSSLTNLSRLTTLPSQANSLCTIKLTNGTQSHYANGFLCQVELSDSVKIYGLFTTFHLLVCSPFKSQIEILTIGLANNSPSLQLLPEHLMWFYPQVGHHFTFLAVSLLFVDIVKNRNGVFLPLARTKPANDSKFFIFHHENGEQLKQFQGKLKDCVDNYLFYEASGLPRVHGSLILNESYEVIGIGNKCRPPQQLGNCITLDIVGRFLEGVHMRKNIPKAVLVENYDVKHVMEPAASVCKVKFDYLKGLSLTGFLCTIRNGSKPPLKGLLTNYHLGIQEGCVDVSLFPHKIKQSLTTIHFDVEEFSIDVTSESIKNIFYDKSLDFIFIQFDTEFVKRIETSRVFLTVCEEEPPKESLIYVLHHPKRNKTSVSKGNVIHCSDDELYHLSDTQWGSAGGPILNKDFKVIGIHKGRGPLDDTGEPMHKTGIRMTFVAKKILGNRLLASN